MRLLRTDIFGAPGSPIVFEEWPRQKSDTHEINSVQSLTANWFDDLPEYSVGNTLPRSNQDPDHWIPPYAILSHTWGKNELLYDDVKRGVPSSKEEGFRKIQFAATQARKDKFRYIWIDTCCIDKDSSAELSEAINSMYAWYRDAGKCYAYLTDVSTEVNASTRETQFFKSRWFKRGWCLQELLAPTDVTFYSKEWRPIGTKLDLQDPIARITKIGTEFLTNERPLESASVAKRMSWAANRETTRLEDRAYSLMGLFDVNMPMLYGEGKKAFHRLQEEIMKHSDDQSLFAWIDTSSPESTFHGLLADAPAAFAQCGDMYGYPDYEERAPFDMTNKGLRIEMNLTRVETDLYAAALNCPVTPGHSGFLAVYLQRLTSGDRQYARVRCAKLASLAAIGSLETVFVRQRPRTVDAHAVYPSHFFQLRRLDAAVEYDLVDVAGRKAARTGVETSTPKATSHATTWVPAGRPSTFKIRKEAGRLTAALLLCRRADGECFVLLLGSITDLKVGCTAVEFAPASQPPRLPPLEDLEEGFYPKEPGRAMELAHHRVRVDVQQEIKEGSKLSLVDIEIEEIGKQGLLPALIETVNVATGPDPSKNRRRIWQKLGIHSEA